MNLDQMRKDMSLNQKQGLHFIATSVVIWALILIVQLLPLPILSKNLWTFICTAPLMPIAWLMAKILKIPFIHKSNPLNSLGGLFTMNQMIYLLIAMWVFPTVPNRMLMVFAMIFGAHLLPYSWLYSSKAYAVMAVFIPVMALIVGTQLGAVWLAAIMVVVEIVFSFWLHAEFKQLAKAA